MKKNICFFLAIMMMCGIFALTGCKHEKEADLSDGMHLTYDKKLSTLDGSTVENKDGHWRIVFHACTSKTDLSSRRTYFENTIKSIANKDVVTDNKTFGGLIFRTEYHTAGDKFAGSYFTELKTPVDTNDILHPLYGIYCYVTAKDDSFVPEIEEAMSGLYIQGITK